MSRLIRLFTAALILPAAAQVAYGASRVSSRYLFALPNASTPATLERAPFTIVRVLYGTDRVSTRSRSGRVRYGNSRGPLAFGSCTVSIPKDHRVGDWEKPTILTLRTGLDQSKHVVFLSATATDLAGFVQLLRNRVARSPRNDAFVFVHGYNVTFAEAVQRTALLAYDLKFDGVPIAFSWPSRGHLDDYPADEESAEYAIPDLQRFLTLVAMQSGATRIHVIAHSMGNRAVLRALAGLQAEGRAPKNLANAVLAAPDVDQDIFRQLVAALEAVATHVTLYASTRDRALKVSRKFHGADPRAGEGGSRLLLINGIDSVDASAVTTDFVAHSYYGDNLSVISDLFDLIRDVPPDERVCLSRRSLRSIPFWVFDRCRR